MNIALFGTSADPPSIGHQQILQWLDNHYDRVLVWVSDNPFKTHQASLSDRLKMMELTIAEIQAHTITIHPELSDPRTINTVEKAKQIWQEANFTLVIGGDLVTQLPTWYRAQDLLNQVKLLVVPRQGVSIANADVERLVSMGTEVAIAPESTSIPNVSSSDYRNNGNSSVIIPTVAAYIQQESLYAWQTSPAPQPPNL
ncbi:nicotinate-nucleotide adenylyltransferase [Pseudanabaena biceps]|nr:nicotinate-nucleotide adenylyltransferase [Pseudanabaena biceps]